jgi:antitoxin component of RelBE/YafQ-DinJ toxin-antitoxin module
MKDTKETPVITFKINEKLKDRFNTASKENGTTMSAVLKAMIVEWLKVNEVVK